MHLSPWLLTITFLTPCIDAFYPYHAKSDKGKARPRRFYPWANTNGVGTDSPEIPTISIRKGRPSGRQLNVRTNDYPVVEGRPPSMKSSMAVNQDGQDYSYFSTLKFGSEGKELYMLVDTGAANTWVMGSDCTTASCKAHNTFGKTDSSTLKVSQKEWSVSYGTGTVSGVVVNDTVSFAGFDLHLGFGSASATSDDFLTYPMDGILGLGRPKSNHLGVPTVMEALDDANLLKANLFGVNLQRNADGATDGEVNFGAWDSSKFAGDLAYTDSVSSDGLWEIPVEDAGVDGKGVGITGRTAILDTGTSFVLMPPADAKELHALIPGSQPDGDNWKIPCSSTVLVQFKFSGKFYGVSHKDYVGAADADGKLCESNIIGHQPFGATQWLLGDVFLKNVYTVFDFDKDRIGFGVNTKGSSQTSPTAAGSSQSTSIPQTPASMPTSSPSITSPENGKAYPSSNGQILPPGSSASATSPSSASGTSASASSSASKGTAAPDTTAPAASGEGLGSAAAALRLPMSLSSMTLIGVMCSLLTLFSGL